jgi:hypothetical protein
MEHPLPEDIEKIGRFAHYPELRSVLLQVLEKMEAGKGSFDDAQRLMVELSRKTGKEALTEWARTAGRAADQATVQSATAGVERHSKKNG